MNPPPEITLTVVRLLVASAVALTLHEAAHVIAATALGVRVKRIGISWRGPFIVREAGAPKVNIWIALAGPVMNLLLAALFWNVVPPFAHINLILGSSNLIPMQGSDGLRVWTASRQLRTSTTDGIHPNLGERNRGSSHAISRDSRALARQADPSLSTLLCGESGTENR